MEIAAELERPCAPGPQRCAQCATRPFSICAAVPDADLERLEALAQTIALERGAVLLREGDPAIRVFNITSGSIRLSKLLPDGRRQVLGFAFAGDFLNLERGETYGWTAETLEPTTVCAFSRRRFDVLIAERRELETALLARASQALALANAQMLLLGRKTALERVASFLLRLPDCDPTRPGDPGQVRLPMTRSDIADYLGLTLETVSRTLSRLKSQGVLRQVSLTELTVENPERLRAAAGD
jgi:CRP/FNR family transcriptional regulator